MPWTDTELDDALARLGADRDRDRGAPDLSTAAGRLVEALPYAVSAPVARKRRHRRRYLGVAVSGGVAAAVAAALLLVPSTKDGRGPVVPSYESVAAMRNAANVTIRQRDLPVRPGQFRYVVDHAYVVPRAGSDHPLAWSYYITTRTWVPYDEQQPWTRDSRSTGPVRWLVGDPAEARRQGITDPLQTFGPADGRDTARCGDFIHRAAQGPCVDPTNGKESTTYSLRRLPRDPEALLPILMGGSREGSADLPPGTADQAINKAGMLLGSGIVPADLRAAIYRALALMPELRITDRFANLDGRVGVAYSVTDTVGNLREDLVIDPGTGQFIGRRQVLTEDDPSLHLAAGTVINSSALTTSVVGAVPPR